MSVNIRLTLAADAPRHFGRRYRAKVLQPGTRVAAAIGRRCDARHQQAMVLAGLPVLNPPHLVVSRPSGGGEKPHLPGLARPNPPPPAPIPDRPPHQPSPPPLPAPRPVHPADWCN